MYRTLFKIRYKDYIFKVQTEYYTPDFGCHPYVHFKIKSRGERAGFCENRMDKTLLDNLADNVVECILTVKKAIDNNKNASKLKEDYKAFLADKDLLRQAVMEKLSNVK